MFTGIIEAMAEVLEKTDTGLTLARPGNFDDIAIGSSIAVSGACLSVIEFNDLSMRFDVVQETWNKTKLGQLQKGDTVNLERAMRSDGRFEGHIVQGHIEGVATCVLINFHESQKTKNPALPAGRQKLKTNWQLLIQIPQELHTFIIPKGSITIDGVSLTVADCTNGICTLALIPHTLENTTLGKLQKGDSVNVETDILGKYILKKLN